MAHVVNHHRDGAHPRARHVPLLAVARHFAERGDRVRFVTGARFAEAVTATGAEHIPLPAEADFDDREDCCRSSRSARRLKGAKAIAFDIEHVFVRPGRAQHDAIMAAHARRAGRRACSPIPPSSGGAFLLGHPLGDRPPARRLRRHPAHDRQPRHRAVRHGADRPCAGPLGRLRNALLSARRRAHGVPASGADRARGQPRAARSAAAVPGPRLATARRGDRAVHGARVRVPALRRPGDPALRRPDLGHRISRRRCRRGGTTSTARRRSSTSRRARSRTATTGRSSPRRSRHSPRTTCSWSCPPADARSTRCRRCPRNARAATYLPYDELLPRTDVYVTNGGYGGVQYALRLRRSRSSRAAARRTSPRSPRASRGPASVADSRPRRRHRRPSAPRCARCSTTRRTGRRHSASPRAWREPAAWNRSPRSSTGSGLTRAPPRPSEARVVAESHASLREAATSRSVRAVTSAAAVAS